MTTAAAVAPPPSSSEVSDVLKERLIDAEYKIWKKNTPYLYDVVMTHALEWPSLTCQWMPTTKAAGNVVEHSLLLGTHTTEGEPNFLMVASCNLPKDDDVVVPNSNAASDNNNNNSTTSTPATAGKENTVNQTNKTTSNNNIAYDEEKGEVGGFGHASSTVGMIDMKMKVPHRGEVNRARIRPQNPFHVATHGPDPEVYVFDLSKHASFPADKESSLIASPQLICLGHTKEGYGLGWSPLQSGYLASGSEDTTVCLWDVSQLDHLASGNNNQLPAKLILKGHTDVVEDVAFHCHDPYMMGSVSDDATIRLWDIRNASGKSDAAIHVVEQAHGTADINCIAFHPTNEYLFATGSADSTVAIWDVRNLKNRTHTLTGHTDQVYMVQWAPFNESILGSCSADRRVGVWDLSRIGMEQSEEDAEDGPPELLFLHGGHTSKVSDFSWNQNDPWAVASVSEDNVLQVWQMGEEIYADADDEDEEDNDDGGAGEDKVLGEEDLE